MANMHKCSDCGRDTDRLGEYYMVKCHVWKAAQAKKPIRPNKDGGKMLCLTDLEKRAAHALKSSDFADPAHANQRGKRGGSFYVAASGRRVYVKKK